MREILRFEDVSYSYEEGRAALARLTVSVGEGERVAVLGENGAGKSTFFLLANGVLVPQTGCVYFESNPIGNKTESLNTLRRGVGLVFQDPDVQIFAGTVEEEISFGPMNLNIPLSEVRVRVDEAVSSFALEEYRQRVPHSLSGGEKKRITLADALAMQPRVLLLDEPASSLDPANAKLLEDNLAMLAARGIALVVATHDVDFAWHWAQRVLIFRKGKLEADGAPENIFADAALLHRCGLEQPLLFRVAEILKLPAVPRTAEELEQEWNA